MDKSNNSYLENEIKFLEQKLAEKRNQYAKGDPLKARELLKETLIEQAKEAQPAFFAASKNINYDAAKTVPGSRNDSTKTVSSVPTIQNKTAVASKSASSAISFGDLKKFNKEKQLDILVHLATSKSVIEAIDYAQRLDNSYVLDKLHDILVDKFYNELVKRGSV